jgi:hypothetical protein
VDAGSKDVRLGQKRTTWPLIFDPAGQAGGSWRKSLTPVRTHGLARPAFFRLALRADGVCFLPP